MSPLWLLPFAMSVGSIPDDAMTVSARIEAESLEVGSEYEIVLTLDRMDGVSVAEAGMPAPILQIKVPSSVKLSGQVLKDYKELARNEFLEAPFERLVVENPLRVPFILRREPNPDEHFVLNVLGYVTANGEDDCRFVRRTLKLPLAPGAVATAQPATTSDWGKTRTLQLGDRALPFTLPRADGTKLALRKYLKKKNIIVTTYRAHW